MGVDRAAPASKWLAHGLLTQNLSGQSDSGRLVGITSATTPCERGF